MSRTAAGCNYQWDIAPNHAMPCSKSAVRTAVLHGAFAPDIGLGNTMHHATRLASLLILGVTFVLPAQHAVAQTAPPDRNARALRAYMQPYAVTKLEWELLQFNLLWSGAYSAPANYLNSGIVVFDYKAMRFRTFFRIAERREYQDPEPWSQLSRVKRESILQGAIDEVRDLLAQSFPELKSRPDLMFIEFKYKQGGGGFVNAAKFENGALSLAE